MQPNICRKCAILRCTQSSSPILFDYAVDGKVIINRDQYPYLGITQCNGHTILLLCICKKASKALNFIRRNLSKCSTKVKYATYLTLVQPIMEYAASVLAPHVLSVFDLLFK